MTSRDFVFWAQGFFELTDAKTLDERQTTLIKRHLNLVFAHDIDPSMGDAEQQAKLNAIHSGGVNQTTPWGSPNDELIDLLHPSSSLHAKMQEIEYANEHGPKPTTKHVINGAFGWALPKDLLRC